jgi:hypothetical protein
VTPEPFDAFVRRVCPDDAHLILAEVERLQTELRRAEAVLVAADRIVTAYEAMLEGRDLGDLPDWTAR